MEFLLALMRHPRIRVAFYSSMRMNNIMQILYELFKNNLGDLYESTLGVFDQQFCTEAGHLVGKQYGFIRDLEKVW